MIRTLILFVISAVTTLADDNFQKGVDAYHESEYESARTAFEEAVQENETGAARHNLALAYYQEKEIGEAVWQLERALLLEPTNEQYHFKLGALRQQLGLTVTRPSWHAVASQSFSQQTWILVLTLSFWLGLGSYILPRIAGKSPSLWIKAVRFLSITGLVFATAALFLNREQLTRGIVIVQTPMDLHAAPASAAPQSGLARPGERAQLLDEYKDFFEIETEGGARGWISSERLRMLQ